VGAILAARFGAEMLAALHEAMGEVSA
jgi:hypothetical protein